MTTRTRIKVRMVIFNILSVSTANDCNEAANFFLTKKKKLMLVNQDQNSYLLHFNLVSIYNRFMVHFSPTSKIN